MSPAADPPDGGTVPRFLRSSLNVLKPICLLVLAGVLATASHLSLSPSLGSIPSVHYGGMVNYLSTFAIVATWMTVPPGTFGPETMKNFTRSIPILASTAPALQLYMVSTARSLGPSRARLVVESMTVIPLMLIVMIVASHLLQQALPCLQTPRRRKLKTLAIGVLLLTPAFVDSWVRRRAPSIIHSNFMLTRMGLILTVAVLYAILLPSRLAVVTAFFAFHILLRNPHTDTSAAVGQLNRMLSAEGYSLVARQESVTGYVSVLENLKEGFRVMRCDHSLLGGQWIHGKGAWPGGAKFKGKRAFPESVYTVFVMLEAVRLVQEPESAKKDSNTHVAEPLDQQRSFPVPDRKAKALVIGLGVGTAPSALAAHGISTTAVEIDPAVARFARDYFHLHQSVTVAVEDAQSFLRRADQTAQRISQKVDRVSISPSVNIRGDFDFRFAAKTKIGRQSSSLHSIHAQSKATEGGQLNRVRRQFDTDLRYHYIIHDVFTGGSEPVDLFTLEFLGSLGEMLTDDGVIAINYASDLLLPSAGLIFRTIHSIFPSCRLFREDKPPNDPSATSDYANMVMFCRKKKGGFDFREPTERDFLGRNTARMALTPKYEVDLEPYLKGEGIVRLNESQELEKWSKQGAEGHWWLMRNSLPDSVWETW